MGQPVFPWNWKISVNEFLSPGGGLRLLSQLCCGHGHPVHHLSGQCGRTHLLHLHVLPKACLSLGVALFQNLLKYDLSRHFVLFKHSRYACRNGYNKKAAMSILRTKPKLARRRMKQNAVSACGHFGESQLKP